MILSSGYFWTTTKFSFHSCITFTRHKTMKYGRSFWAPFSVYDDCKHLRLMKNVNVRRTFFCMSLYNRNKEQTTCRLYSFYQAIQKSNSCFTFLNSSSYQAIQTQYQLFYCVDMSNLSTLVTFELSVWFSCFIYCQYSNWASVATIHWCSVWANYFYTTKCLMGTLC